MKISNELKECFKYFNVYDISDKIKELSEKERYILAISSVDNHDEDNVICLHNFNSIRTEINNILSFPPLHDQRRNCCNTLAPVTNIAQNIIPAPCGCAAVSMIDVILAINEGFVD